MTAYKDMTLDQRRAEYAALQTAFADLKAQGLKLDMTRGKPCKDQLDMVSDIFDMLKEPEDYIVDGIDIRNYGALSGLRRPSACSQTFWTASPSRYSWAATPVCNSCTA